MATKFHISTQDGVVRPCDAQPGNCKYGSDADHYATEADGRKAYEAQMAGKVDALAGIKKFKPSAKDALKAKLGSRNPMRKINDPANGYVDANGYPTKEGRELAARSPEVAKAFGDKLNQKA